MAASQPLTIMLCWKFTTDYDGTLMATNPDQPILETARESCIKPGHLMNRGKSATVSSNISILDKFLDIQHLFCGADVFATNKKTTTTSDCWYVSLGQPLQPEEQTDKWTGSYVFCALSLLYSV
ncbi:hypothetical protein PGT21_019553 [Puccinia graminis f. sp. tritici]|uniref:Uncharacterized protein n=1 Tax=Puccinia graminis f. sp. tritici TaxID=56615 RepID=A0A5B0SJM7_PUCGR|nr:hypothetical protein PGT21_019553 [Puccinia graminis f. sp. tritici]KAA1138092.1 hypothetical protein PGTUg99_030455 [Puccinia graminis f. sp. tritici]